MSAGGAARHPARGAVHTLRPPPFLLPYMAATPARATRSSSVATGPRKGAAWVDVAVVGGLLLAALWVLWYF